MEERDYYQKLIEAKQAKWFDKRLKALSKLSRARRRELKRLIPNDKGIYDEFVAFARRLEMTAEFFDTMDDRERRRLFDGLFPSMGAHVDRSWVDACEQPFVAGYRQTCFRAPGRASVARLTRARHFLMVCSTLQGYDPTPGWLARWGPHMPDRGGTVGLILAAVLRGGGDDADEVRSILIDSINGDDEIGRMGVHAITALLNSDERTDWEIIGKLLLAAQRQEGLRQTILESADEANPGAFRYMLGLILEHDLGRFSSVVRAFDIWLGFQWAGGSAKVVHDGIRKICAYLDDGGACVDAIESGTPEDAYLALWSMAYADADAALRVARTLVGHADPARRYAALLIIVRAGLMPECLEIPAGRLISGEERDERILTLLLVMIAQVDFREAGFGESDALFDAIAEIFGRFPKKKTKLDRLIWPWDAFVRERRDAALALRAVAVEAPKKLLPYADALDPFDCAAIVRTLSGTGRVWNPETNREQTRKRRDMDTEERTFVVCMMADARQEVHNAAFEALKSSKVAPDEVEILTKNLHRTSATFRRGAIERLSKLAAPAVLSVGEGLLDAKHVKKRAAGLELLQAIKDDKKVGGRALEAVRARLETLSLDSETEAVAKRVLGKSADEVTLDDCLGLLAPGSRAAPVEPNETSPARESAAMRACLKSLAELFLEHSETEIELNDEYLIPGERGTMGHLGSNFPSPPRGTPKEGEARRSPAEAMPLHDVWSEWVQSRGKEMRDKDGLELVRLWALVNNSRSNWGELKVLPKAFRATGAWELKWAFQHLTEWLPILEPNDNGLSFLARCAEDRLARIKSGKIKPPKEHAIHHKPTLLDDYSSVTSYARLAPRGEMDASILARVAALKMVSMDLGHGVSGPDLDEFAAAYDAGLATPGDFIWLLLKPQRRDGSMGYWDARVRFGPIDSATSLKPAEALARRPELAEVATRVRERLIEVELTRGERATPATLAASHIRFAGGAETLFRLVSALGKDKIIRQDQWGEPTRSYSFSRLISVTMPREADSDERFTGLLAEYAIKPARMLEVGMYAPQWAGHVERALGIDGFEDSVWWIHAHTKRGDYWRNEEIRELWAAQINERTELEAEDLEEGAVDVAWFKRIIDRIGIDVWADFQKPAKYASSSGGHKRAQLFADAMVGRVTVDDLMPRIDEKRNQDSVRALGLVPLSGKPADAAAETLRRYQRLEEFKRQSRQFGSQRQASEGRAIDIAMQNLARTAGYRDPRRLQWAMEAEAVADLAKGPVSVSVEETTVTLAIDESGAPDFTVVKKGKPLKSVPAKLRKHEPIVDLKSRVTDLRRQSSRMRLSLEEAMCRGDVFTGAELGDLSAHPMLRPMIERLVFVSAKDAADGMIGYPEKKAKVLRHVSGNVEPVGKRDPLRLAHPSDLLARGEWSAWQRECFETERVQPFKQIFRELYPRTKAESGKADMSKRYAGHQVNPRQALALFKKRQWIFAPEEGCRRVFHDEGLVAEIWFQEHFYTPADVDGLTFEGLTFRRKGAAWEYLKLAEVPDRVFSEAMRDLDLVVSVAHAGGVDPEASASTVDMRAALLRETSNLLGLDNVRVEGQHAMVEGNKANYSIHLGSASTKVLPGRMLVIVAVQSQYRGRLFLPFADEDPRTAEVMAKVLLLARDHEIKDPMILEQIG
ncbi:MAG: DUF5724 domain-containing protein [Planctomycetota bacterium]